MSTQVDVTVEAHLQITSIDNKVNPVEMLTGCYEEMIMIFNEANHTNNAIVEINISQRNTMPSVPANASTIISFARKEELYRSPSDSFHIYCLFFPGTAGI